LPLKLFELNVGVCLLLLLTKFNYIKKTSKLKACFVEFYSRPLSLLVRKKINSYTVISVNATSLLEALREARQKQLNCLQDDFFLVNGKIYVLFRVKVRKLFILLNQILGDTFLTQGVQHLKNLYLNHCKTVKQDSSRLMTRLVGELPSLPPCDSCPVSHKAILR
jgi:hypothetical protein